MSNNTQLPISPNDPNYLQLPYDKKKLFLETFLRREIYDFEYENGIPEDDDLEDLDDDLQETVVQAVRDYATDISEEYAKLIIKYIDLMVSARIGA